MSKLPTNFDRGLGWKPDVPDMRDFRYSAHLVDQIDTAIALKPHMLSHGFRKLPITDQRQTSACTGHSTSRHWAQERHLTPRSPLYTYYQARKIEGDTNADEGAFIRDVFKGLGAEGSPRDDLWPDIDSNLFKEPDLKAEHDAEKRLPMQYQRIGATGDANHIRSDILGCIAAGHSFVTGVSCYDSIFSDRTSRTGLVLLPSTNEKMQGGHALVFGEAWINDTFKDSSYAQSMRQRGISDSLFPKEVICCANSWGTEYGLDGYYFFDLNYLTNRDLADDTWTSRAK